VHFALSDEQLLLQQLAEDVGVQLFSGAAIHAAGTDGGALRAAAWKRLVELDLVGLLVPADVGGAGGSLTDACVVAEGLGRHVAPLPYVGTAIAAAAFLRVGAGVPEAQADLAAGGAYSVLLDERLGLAGGRAVLAFDWSPGAWGVALGADRAVVVDLVDEGPLDDVDPVHPLRRVAPVPTSSPATESARRAVAAAWTGAAAYLLGLADGALCEAVAYAGQREQYGRPIGSFQAIQHICADMLVDVETSRSIVYGASWAVDAAAVDEAERLAAAAKAYVGDAAVRVCEAGIQVLGGIGVTREHGSHLRLRSAHLHNAAFGGTDAPLAVLATGALADG